MHKAHHSNRNVNLDAGCAADIYHASDVVGTLHDHDVDDEMQSRPVHQGGMLEQGCMPGLTFIWSARMRFL